MVTSEQRLAEVRGGGQDRTGVHGEQDVNQLPCLLLLSARYKAFDLKVRRRVWVGEKAKFLFSATITTVK